MEVRFPIKQSILAILLTLSVVLVAFYTINQQLDHIKIIRSAHIPILEHNAINVRLSQKVNEDLFHYIQYKDPNKLESFLFHRDYLQQNLNELLSYKNKVNIHFPQESLNRNPLNSLENKIIKFMHQKNYLQAKSLFESEDYQKLSENFVLNVGKITEQLSIERDADIIKKEQWQYIFFFGAVLTITLVLFLWAYIFATYKKNSQRAETLATELESERAKVAYNSQMELLANMATGIAHEINNPLTIISGLALKIKKVLQRGDDLTKLEGASESILENAKRVSVIIKALREFAKDSNDDHMQVMDIKELVNEAILLIQKRFQMLGITIKFDSPKEEFLVEAMPSQLGNVFLQLLHNSKDALQDCTNKDINITLKKTSSHVLISFIDSGPGPSEEIKKNLFIPFKSGKDIGEGQGMGLSIAKGIIEGHNGLIYYKDDTPETTFVIEIPLYQKQENVA